MRQAKLLLETESGNVPDLDLKDFKVREKPVTAQNNNRKKIPLAKFCETNNDQGAASSERMSTVRNSANDDSYSLT